MGKVSAASHPPALTSASMLRCAECGSAGVSDARKFPPGQAVGVTVVCPRCAAISLVEGGRCRSLRTIEWANTLMEPSGYSLLEERFRVARRLNLPSALGR